MSGPIVRSGPSPEFSKNWDSVFGKGKKPGGGSAGEAAAKKTAQKTAVKKPAKKAAVKKPATAKKAKR